MEEWALHCWQPLPKEDEDSQTVWFSTTDHPQEERKLVTTHLGDVYGREIDTGGKNSSESVAEQAYIFVSRICIWVVSRRNVKNHATENKVQCELYSKESSEYGNGYSQTSSEHGNNINVDFCCRSGSVRKEFVEYISSSPLDISSKSIFFCLQIQCTNVVRVLFVYNRDIFSGVRFKCFDVLASGWENLTVYLVTCPLASTLSQRAGHRLIMYSIEGFYTEISLCYDILFDNAGIVKTARMVSFDKVEKMRSAKMVSIAEPENTCKNEENKERSKLFSVYSMRKVKVSKLFPCHHVNDVDTVDMFAVDFPEEVKIPRLFSSEDRGCWFVNANNNSNTSQVTETEESFASNAGGISMLEHLGCSCCPRKRIKSFKKARMLRDSDRDYMLCKRDYLLKKFSAKDVYKQRFRQRHGLLRPRFKKWHILGSVLELVMADSWFVEHVKIHQEITKYGTCCKSETEVNSAIFPVDQDTGSIVLPFKAISPFSGASSPECNPRVSTHRQNLYNNIYSTCYKDICNKDTGDYLHTICSSDSEKISQLDKTHLKPKFILIDAKNQTSTISSVVEACCGSAVLANGPLNYGMSSETRELNKNSKDRNYNCNDDKETIPQMKIQHRRAGSQPHVSEKYVFESKKTRVYQGLRAFRQEGDNAATLDTSKSKKQAFKGIGNKLKMAWESRLTAPDSQKLETNAFSDGHAFRQNCSTKTSKYCVHMVSQDNTVQAKPKQDQMGTYHFQPKQKREFPRAVRKYVSPDVFRHQLRMSPAALKTSLKKLNKTVHDPTLNIPYLRLCPRHNEDKSSTHDKVTIEAPNSLYISEGENDLCNEDCITDQVQIDKDDAHFAYNTNTRYNTENSSPHKISNYANVCTSTAKNFGDTITVSYNSQEKTQPGLKYDKVADTHLRQGDGLNARSNYKYDDTETSTYNEDVTWSRSLRREGRRSQGKSNLRNVFIDPKVTREMRKKVEILVTSYRNFLEKEQKKFRMEGKSWAFDDMEEARRELKKDWPGINTSDHIKHTKQAGVVFSSPGYGETLTDYKDKERQPMDSDKIQESPYTALFRENNKNAGYATEKENAVIDKPELKLSRKTVTPKSKIKNGNFGFVGRQSELTRTKSLNKSSIIKGVCKDSRTTEETVTKARAKECKPPSKQCFKPRISTLSTSTNLCAQNYLTEFYDGSKYANLPQKRTTDINHPPCDLILTYDMQNGELRCQNLTECQQELGQKKATADEGSQCFTFLINDRGKCTYKGENKTIPSPGRNRRTHPKFKEQVEPEYGQSKKSRIPIYVGNKTIHGEVHCQSHTNYRYQHSAMMLSNVQNGTPSKETPRGLRQGTRTETQVVRKKKAQTKSPTLPTKIPVRISRRCMQKVARSKIPVAVRIRAAKRISTGENLSERNKLPLHTISVCPEEITFKKSLKFSDVVDTEPRVTVRREKSSKYFQPEKAVLSRSACKEQLDYRSSREGDYARLENQSWIRSSGDQQAAVLSVKSPVLIEYVSFQPIRAVGRGIKANTAGQNPGEYAGRVMETGTKVCAEKLMTVLGRPVKKAGRRTGSTDRKRCDGQASMGNRFKGEVATPGNLAAGINKSPHFSVAKQLGSASRKRSHAISAVRTSPSKIEEVRYTAYSPNSQRTGYTDFANLSIQRITRKNLLSSKEALIPTAGRQKENHLGGLAYCGKKGNVMFGQDSEDDNSLLSGSVTFKSVCSVSSTDSCFSFMLPSDTSLEYSKRKVSSLSLHSPAEDCRNAFITSKLNTVRTTKAVDIFDSLTSSWHTASAGDSQQSEGLAFPDITGDEQAAHLHNLIGNSSSLNHHRSSRSQSLSQNNICHDRSKHDTSSFSTMRNISDLPFTFHSNSESSSCLLSDGQNRSNSSYVNSRQGSSNDRNDIKNGNYNASNRKIRQSSSEPNMSATTSTDPCKTSRVSKSDNDFSSTHALATEPCKYDAFQSCMRLSNNSDTPNVRMKKDAQVVGTSTRQIHQGNNAGRTFYAKVTMIPARQVRGHPSPVPIETTMNEFLLELHSVFQKKHHLNKIPKRLRNARGSRIKYSPKSLQTKTGTNLVYFCNKISPSCGQEKGSQINIMGADCTRELQCEEKPIGKNTHERNHPKYGNGEVGSPRSLPAFANIVKFWEGMGTMLSWRNTERNAGKSEKESKSLKNSKNVASDNKSSEENSSNFHSAVDDTMGHCHHDMVLKEWPQVIEKTDSTRENTGEAAEINIQQKPTERSRRDRIEARDCREIMSFLDNLIKQSVASKRVCHRGFQRSSDTLFHSPSSSLASATVSLSAVVSSPSNPQATYCTKTRPRMEVKDLLHRKISLGVQKMSQEMHNSGVVMYPFAVTKGRFEKTESKQVHEEDGVSSSSTYKSIANNYRKYPVKMSAPKRVVAVGGSPVSSLHSVIETTPQKVTSNEMAQTSREFLTAVADRTFMNDRHKQQVAETVKNISNIHSVATYSAVSSSDQCFPISAGLDYAPESSPEQHIRVVKGADRDGRQKSAKRLSKKPIKSHAFRTNQNKVWKQEDAMSMGFDEPEQMPDNAKLSKHFKASETAPATQKRTFRNGQRREGRSIVPRDFLYSENLEQTVRSATCSFSERSFGVQESLTHYLKMTSPSTSKTKYDFRDVRLVMSSTTNLAFSREHATNKCEQTTTEEIHSSELDKLSASSCHPLSEQDERIINYQRRTKETQTVSNSVKGLVTPPFRRAGGSREVGLSSCGTVVLSKGLALGKYHFVEKPAQRTRCRKKLANSVTHTCRENTDSDVNDPKENFDTCSRRGKLSPWRRSFKTNVGSMQGEYRTTCDVDTDSSSDLTNYEEKTVPSSSPGRSTRVKPLRQKDVVDKLKMSRVPRHHKTSPARTVILSAKKSGNPLRSPIHLLRFSREERAKEIRKTRVRKRVLRTKENKQLPSDSSSSESLSATEVVASQKLPQKSYNKQERRLTESKRHRQSRELSHYKNLLGTSPTDTHVAEIISQNISGYSKSQSPQKHEEGDYRGMPTSERFHVDRHKLEAVVISPLRIYESGTSKSVSSSSQEYLLVRRRKLTPAGEVAFSLKRNQEAFRPPMTSPCKQSESRKAVKCPPVIKINLPSKSALHRKLNKTPVRSKPATSGQELHITGSHRICDIPLPEISPTQSKLLKRPSRTPFTIQVSRNNHTPGKGLQNTSSQCSYESPGDTLSKGERNTKSYFLLSELDLPVVVARHDLLKSEVLEALHKKTRLGIKALNLCDSNSNPKQYTCKRCASCDLLVSSRHFWKSRENEYMHSVPFNFKRAGVTDILMTEKQRCENARQDSRKGSLLKSDNLQECAKKFTLQKYQSFKFDSQNAEKETKYTPEIQNDNRQNNTNEMNTVGGISSYKRVLILEGNSMLKAANNLCSERHILDSQARPTKHSSAPCLSSLSIDVGYKTTGGIASVHVSQDTTSGDFSSERTTTAHRDSSNSHPAPSSDKVCCVKHRSGEEPCLPQTATVDVSKHINANGSSQRSRDIEIVLGNDISLREFMSYLFNGLQLNNSGLRNEDESSYASLNSQVRLVIDKVFDKDQVTRDVDVSNLKECKTSPNDGSKNVKTCSSAGARRSDSKDVQQPKKLAAEEKGEYNRQHDIQNDHPDKNKPEAPDDTKKQTVIPIDSTNMRGLTCKKKNMDNLCVPVGEKQTSQQKSPMPSSAKKISNDKIKHPEQTLYLPRRERGFSSHNKTFKNTKELNSVNNVNSRHKKMASQRRRYQPLVVSSSSDSVLLWKPARRIRKGRRDGPEKHPRQRFRSNANNNIVRADRKLTQDKLPCPSAPVLNLIETTTGKVAHKEPPVKRMGRNIRVLPDEQITFSKPQNSHLEKVIKTDNKLTITFTANNKMNNYTKSKVNARPTSVRPPKQVKGLNDTLIEKESQILLSRDAFGDREQASCTIVTGKVETRDYRRAEGYCEHPCYKDGIDKENHIHVSADVITLELPHLNDKTWRSFSGRKGIAPKLPARPTMDLKTLKSAKEGEINYMSLDRPMETLSSPVLSCNPAIRGQHQQEGYKIPDVAPATATDSSSWCSDQDLLSWIIAKKHKKNKPEKNKTVHRLSDKSWKASTDSKRMTRQDTPQESTNRLEHSSFSSDQSETLQMQQIVKLFSKFLSGKRYGRGHSCTRKTQKTSSKLPEKVALNENDENTAGSNTPKANVCHVYKAGNQHDSELSKISENSVKENSISDVKMSTPDTAAKHSILSYGVPLLNMDLVHEQSEEAVEHGCCVQFSDVDSKAASNLDRFKTVGTSTDTPHMELRPVMKEDNSLTETTNTITPGRLKTVGTSTDLPGTKLRSQMKDDDSPTETTDTVTSGHIRTIGTSTELPNEKFTPARENKYSLTETEHETLKSKPIGDASIYSYQNSQGKKPPPSPFSARRRGVCQTSSHAEERCLFKSSTSVLDKLSSSSKILKSREAREIAVSPSTSFVVEDNEVCERMCPTKPTSMLSGYNEIKVKTPCSMYSLSDSISVSLLQTPERKCLKLVIPPDQLMVPYEIVLEPENWNDGPAVVMSDNGIVHVRFERARTEGQQHREISSEFRGSTGASSISGSVDDKGSISASASSSYVSVRSCASSYDHSLHDSYRVNETIPERECQGSYDTATEFKGQKSTNATGMRCKSKKLIKQLSPNAPATTLCTRCDQVIKSTQNEMIKKGPRDLQCAVRERTVDAREKSQQMAYKSEGCDARRYHEIRHGEINQSVTLSPVNFASNEGRGRGGGQSRLTRNSQTGPDVKQRNRSKETSYEPCTPPSCVTGKKKTRPESLVSISASGRSNSDDRDSKSNEASSDVQTDGSASSRENMHHYNLCSVKAGSLKDVSKVSQSSGELDESDDTSSIHFRKTQMSSSRTSKKPGIFPNLPSKQSKKCVDGCIIRTQLARQSTKDNKKCQLLDGSRLPRQTVVKFKEPQDSDVASGSSESDKESIMSQKSQPKPISRTTTQKVASPQKTNTVAGRVTNWNASPNTHIKCSSSYRPQQSQKVKLEADAKSAFRPPVAKAHKNNSDSRTCDQLKEISKRPKLLSCKNNQNRESFKATGSFPPKLSNTEAVTLTSSSLVKDSPGLVSEKGSSHSSRPYSCASSSENHRVHSASGANKSNGPRQDSVSNRQLFKTKTEGQTRVADNRSVVTQQSQVRFSDKVIEQSKAERKPQIPVSSQVRFPVIAQNANIIQSTDALQRMQAVTTASTPVHTGMWNMYPHIINSPFLLSGGDWQHRSLYASPESVQHDPVNSFGGRQSAMTSSHTESQVLSSRPARTSLHGRNRGTRIARCLKRPEPLVLPISKQHNVPRRLKRQPTSITERADSGYSELSTPTETSLCEWDRSVKMKLQERMRHIFTKNP